MLARVGMRLQLKQACFLQVAHKQLLRTRVLVD
jgi:hypothetical protein